MHHHNDKTLVALADSTGHGIPGAFMSLLGTMALKIVMSKINFLNPNIILKLLNSEIIKLLHQRGNRTDTLDTIDIALCVFDFQSNMLEYAGANIPLYIARKNEQNQSIISRIKPKKVSIGYDNITDSFTIHSFKLNKGDKIYLSSDGFSDQFGGEDNKKLKRCAFLEILKDMSEIQIDYQQDFLEDFLKKWMGNNEQVDDIMLFGLEI
jgi:serine phosphatase RsbU (regulator of sigma subunit)